MKLKVLVYRFNTSCWRCGGSIEVVYPKIELREVEDDFLIPPVTREMAEKLGLKLVYSRTLGQWTYGNVCKFCGAYQGWWFVWDELIDRLSDGKDYKQEVHEFEVPIDEEVYQEYKEAERNMREEISTCPLCGKKTLQLHSHHVSYDPEDVILICNSCHAKIHASMRNSKNKAKKKADQG